MNSFHTLLHKHHEKADRMLPNRLPVCCRSDWLVWYLLSLDYIETTLYIFINHKGASWPWSCGNCIYNYLCNQCLLRLLLLLLPHNGHNQLVDCYAMSKACAVRIYKILPTGSSIKLETIYIQLKTDVVSSNLDQGEV